MTSILMFIQIPFLFFLIGGVFREGTIINKKTRVWFNWILIVVTLTLWVVDKILLKNDEIHTICYVINIIFIIGLNADYILKTRRGILVFGKAGYGYNISIKHFIEEHKLDEMDEESAIKKLKEIVNSNTGMSFYSLKDKHIAEILLDQKNEK